MELNFETLLIPKQFWAQVTVDLILNSDGKVNIIIPPPWVLGMLFSRLMLKKYYKASEVVISPDTEREAAALKVPTEAE